MAVPAASGPDFVCRCWIYGCIYLLQEDPRLKFPVHLRTKASLNPNDLGPLPVSDNVYVFGYMPAIL